MLEYPPIPTEVFDLTNTLGKFEMERAAEIILRRVIKRGSWEIDFGISDFQIASDYTHKAETGFLWLLHHGWMDEGSASPCFWPSPELAQHLLKLKDVEVGYRHLVV